MIKHLELKNFTAFGGLSIDFSPKINIIIGANSTGKTHLLKVAYGLCTSGSHFKNNPDLSDEELGTVITSRLLGLFMPLDDKLGKMHHRGASSQACLQAEFKDGQKIDATFSRNSGSLIIRDKKDYQKYDADAVFIPTKEVLSFMEGFNSLYAKYNLSFDQTYQHICLLLDLPKIRPENLHEKSGWAMAAIEEICGGQFVFHGGGKVTFKTGRAEYSANAIAEGFRKVGLLARLLETGAIQPGISGSLFWDEPESNLNPGLMKLLVRILLELSRYGQQIILATHDYVLLKWFDLLMDKGEGDHARFHVLNRNIESGGIEVESTDDYNLISNSAISDTFAELYDQDVKRALG